MRWLCLLMLVVLSLATVGYHVDTDAQGEKVRQEPYLPHAEGSLAEEISLPDGASQGWWRSVQRGLAEGEYHVSENGKGLQAPNRVHNLRTYFEPNGIRLHDRTVAGSPELVGLSLVGIGRGAELAPVEAGTVTHAGARVEIQRPGVIEWYKNSPQGLEQGFTLAARAKGKGPLVLELAVKRARASLRGQSVELATDAGRRLRYGKLIAQDANGQILVSRLEVPTPQRVRLVVEDAEAVYPLVIDPLITAVPDTVLESNQPDPGSFDAAVFGGSVSSAGDVNGDGWDDVIVGARGWDNGLFDEGAAFVFLGSSAGIVTTPHAVIQSSQASAEFGVSVAGAGDVNGDGYGDIIVGSNFYDGILPGTNLRVDGAAFVFHGGPLGIVATDPTMADALIEANQIDSFLGFSVAGAGDVNGDGFDDIIVGVPRQGSPTFPPNIPPNEGQGTGGAALVFHGSAAGITGTGFSDANAVLLPYPTGFPEPSGTLMGADVSGAGDVNGDGFDDILVNATGAVLFLGSSTGIVGTDPTTAHAHISGPGTVVSAAGDVNGDGFGDIIVGNPGWPNITPGLPTSDSGNFGVFLGSPAGITATDFSQAQTIVQGSTADALGRKVAGAGDIDNDGFDDIIVGALGYAGSLNSEGVAYVFRGGPSGIVASTLLDAYVRLESNQSEAVRRLNRHEIDVAGAGDVNGDGFADVILGLGFYDVDQLNEGAAFIYHGGPAPINPNQPPVADAGADQVVIDLDDNGSEEVTLDGTASFDPDGTIVSYEWYEGETLLGTNPVLTTSLTTTGDHTLVLTVTDDAGITRGDLVTVRVELVGSVQTLFDGFTTGFDFAPWVTGGDVTLSSVDTFPDPPQVRIGASGSFLSTTLAMPVGNTGMTVSFWGKASQFSALDKLLVKVSVDGGPFTTIHTITSAESNDTYVFYGGSAIPIGLSWFPVTASNIVLAFESNMTTGLFFIDDVKVRALQAPLTNQSLIANAGADQTVTDSDGNGVETVTLNGTASSDPNGTIVSYEWREGATLLGIGSTLGVSFGVGAHTVTLTVTDNDGGSASDTVVVTVTVNPAPPGPAEALTITRFEFRAGKNEWRIAGTSTIPGPGNTMTLYIGPTAPGPVVLGTAPVDNLGFWEFREKDSPVVLDSTGTISIQSSQGGTWEGISGVGPAPGSNPPPSLASISVTPGSVSLEQGQTQQFTATGTFSDGNTSDLTATATWSSSNTSVATINAAGLASGMLAGTTNIAASQGGFTSNTGQLTVTTPAPPPPTPEGSVSISGPTSVNRGDQASFTVTLTNSGTSILTNVELSFNISPDRRIKNISPGSLVAVADVPPGGSVSQTWSGAADKEGSATVTAEAFSGGISISMATQPLTVVK